MNRRERGLMGRLGIYFLGLLSLSLAGCATFDAAAPIPHLPRAVASQPFQGGAQGIALVLSGGTSRGFAHIGVIKVLEANGIRPDVIVGTSAGALIGALYASGLSARELEAAMAELEMSVFDDLVWPRFGVMPGELGILSGEKLRRFVSDRLKTPLIEDFPIRFAAVATDMNSGATVAFNSGDASLAVKASLAVPGMMTPVRIGDATYIDGQVSSPVPVSEARRLHARIVLAVDVIYPPGDSLMTNPFRVAFQAFSISTYRLRELQLREADVAVQPRIPHTSGQLGIGVRESLITAGERAATEGMPEIRAAIARLRLNR